MTPSIAGVDYEETAGQPLPIVSQFREYFLELVQQLCYLKKNR